MTTSLIAVQTVVSSAELANFSADGTVRTFTIVFLNEINSSTLTAPYFMYSWNNLSSRWKINCGRMNSVCTSTWLLRMISAERLVLGYEQSGQLTPLVAAKKKQVSTQS